jgi:3',5'-cyclic AMP phosphodiesterase CpdA
MKKSLALKLLTLLFILLNVFGCQSEIDKKSTTTPDEFTFVFMTDIHLQPELNAVQGFRQAIDSVNKIDPDFVITGGDLIMDALGQHFSRADSLYQLFSGELKHFKMPVYNTMGNHEIFGIYRQRSGVDGSHPQYGENMFEQRLGKRYYSFDHKGWHFMILDGIEDSGNDSYLGLIDSVQMDWIRSDLAKVDTSRPIAISIHIPLLTVITQLERGSLEPNGKGTVVNNAREVIEMFDHHNLKLVLQGHLHYIEDIYVSGTHFITGGAVSARWWAGPYRGMEEGFVVINVKGDDFDWHYFDFGWDAKPAEKI